MATSSTFRPTKVMLPNAVCGSKKGYVVGLIFFCVCLSVFTPERKYAICFWVIRNVFLGSMWDCVCGSINYVSKLDVCDPVLFVRVFLCAGMCSIFTHVLPTHMSVYILRFCEDSYSYLLRAPSLIAHRTEVCKRSPKHCLL